MIGYYPGTIAPNPTPPEGWQLNGTALICPKHTLTCVITTPLTLHCPRCNFRHIDEGAWKTHPHKTHLCGRCNHEWRPFDYATCGIMCR